MLAIIVLLLFIARPQSVMNAARDIDVAIPSVCVRHTLALF